MITKRTAFEEILTGEPISEEKIDDKRRKVFLVHGQNTNVRDKLDLYMTKELGLEVEVMEAGANQGLTLPEKFERIAKSCAFAVLLFTTDDAFKDDHGMEIKRARQNVVLECGYFWGRLGREKRIAVLVEKPKEIELPSDISGLGWIPITSDLFETKDKLRRELVAAGLVR